jgi:hypothetical protein
LIAVVAVTAASHTTTEKRKRVPLMRPMAEQLRLQHAGDGIGSLIPDRRLACIRRTSQMNNWFTPTRIAILLVGGAIITYLLVQTALVMSELQPLSSDDFKRQGLTLAIIGVGFVGLAAYVVRIIRRDRRSNAN